MDDPFSFRLTASGQVMISRGGRVITTLGGKSGARVISALETASADEQQLILAKSTGNYKRGNER
jgi:hypothetical protein